MLVPMAWYDGIVGFFNTIMTPLYWVVSGLLVFFHYLWAPLFGTDNGWTWTLSIVCLTVIIRTALIPLFVKQIKSSRSMQLLQPKVRELQKKYGHDREKLGQETMKLYRENNANPLSSCLPLLLQMPIFLALFWVLNEASNGKALGPLVGHQPRSGVVAGERHHLRRPDLRHLHETGFANGINSIHILTIFLILAMTATLFITQLQLMRKNMPPEALTGPFAQQQKMMLYLFPIIFAVGGINFPVGVLIYWFTSNLWTMGQQFYVIRRNPAPGTPAFDAWEARRKAKAAHKHRGHEAGPRGRRPARPRPAGNGRTRRQPERGQRFDECLEQRLGPEGDPSATSQTNALTTQDLNLIRSFAVAALRAAGADERSESGLAARDPGSTHERHQNGHVGRHPTAETPHRRGVGRGRR